MVGSIRSLSVIYKFPIFGIPTSTPTYTKIAIIPSTKCLNPSGDFCFSVAVSCEICGSGIFIINKTKNANTKIPIARNSAGLASVIDALDTSPIRYPTSTGTIVAPIEFKVPPNCSN